MDVVTLGPISLSNRDLATAYWLFVLGAWVLSKPDVADGVWRAVKTGGVFLLPLLLYAAWVSALILSGREIGLWDETLVKDTVAWFLLAGLGLFFSFVKAGSEAGFFRRAVLKTISVSVWVEFYLNLAVFDFWIEWLLQPVLLFAALLSVLGGRDQQTVPAKRFADTLLLVLGLALVVGTGIDLANSWGTRDAGATLLSLALPIWLTIGVLPFIWILAAWANYQSAFMRVRWLSPEKRMSWRSRLTLLSTFHVRHHEMRGFGGFWARRLGEAPSWRGARRVVHDFLADRRGHAEAVRRKQEVLDRNAGVPGADVHGRRLDRREVAETVDALEWLATCQMGWYRNRTKGRYPADLLKIFQPGHTRGLPTEHGIQMKVRANGKVVVRVATHHHGLGPCHRRQGASAGSMVLRRSGASGRVSWL